MKKILSVLLSLLLLCSCIPLGAVTAANVGMVYGTVDRSDVAPGDTFTMSVQMENNPGLVCWLIDVDFDSAALELVSQTKGDAFNGMGTFSFGPIKEGYTNALWYDFLAMDDYTNNGHLFSLTFRVKEGAPAGDYPITLYCSDWDNMCNIDFERVDFDFVSPTVTVATSACEHVYDNKYDADCNVCGAVREVDTTMLGDTNGDGKVNVRDLGLLQQYLNHWCDITSVDGNGDVVADDHISVRDFGLLQQCLNGWDVKLGADMGNDYTASSAYVYGMTDKNTLVAGQEFLYTVMIRDNPGLAGWHITVDFDTSALELLQISGGDAFPQSGLSYGPMTSPTGVTYADFINDDVTATGTLFSMRFRVKSDVSPGEYFINLSTPHRDNFSTQDYKIASLFFETQNITVAGHQYVGVVTKAATCGAAGVMTYTCSACGDAYTVAIPATGAHTYSSATDATCNQCGAMREVDNSINIYGMMDKNAVTIGETFNVYVYIENNPGLCGWNVQVHFDETAFELLQMNAGTVFPANKTYYGPLKNPASVTYADYISSDVHGDGLMYSLIFRVKDTAALGDYTFTLGTSNNDLDNFCNEAWDTFSVNFENVSTTVVAHTHTYQSAVTIAPTCVTNGVMTYTCYDCGDSYTESIPATGEHIYKEVVTAPDCTNGGYTTYTCTVCAHTYMGDYTAALSHNYNSEVTVTPTCGTEGVMTYTCSVCGDSYTMPISATGNHTYDNICDAICNVCGGVRKVPGHSFVGSFTCAVCGYALDLDSDQIIYGEVDMSTVAPGDTFTVTVNMANNPGLSGWIVDLAYDLDLLEIVDMVKGDTFNHGTMAFGPTDKLPTNVLWYDFLNGDVTDNGMLFTITFRVKAGAPVGNSVIYLYCSDADNICNSAYENVAFDFVSAVVSVMDHHHAYDNVCDATCNICDEVREVEPHAYESEVTLAPTCVVDGVMTYTCTICGDSYTEAIASNGQHAYESEITLSATCGTDGVMTYTCSVCGDSYTEVIPATGDHTYEPEITLAPTCVMNGVMTYTCTVCDDSYTESIPATGDHTYDNVCDATCNVCGGVREVPGHSFVGSFTCSICGYALNVNSDPIIYGTVDVADAAPGETFTLTVNMTNNPGLSGWLVGVDYDIRSLELINQTAGDIFNPVAFGPKDTLPTRASWYDFLSGDTTASGVLFSFTFRVKEGVATGDTILKLYSTDPDNFTTVDGQTVYFDFVDAVVSLLDHRHVYESAVTTAATCGADGLMTYTCSVCNHSYTEVIPATGDHTYESAVTTAPTCVAEGVLTYTCSVCGDSYTESIPATGVHTYDDDDDATCNDCDYVRELTDPGDVNKDGKVNIRDVGLMQQWMNGWDVEMDEKAADVNNDGKINIRDVGLMQQWMNGWDVELI